MRPILLRDACVVTLDPVLGELSRGAVLIEGDRIARTASIRLGGGHTMAAAIAHKLRIRTLAHGGFL